MNVTVNFGCRTVGDELIETDEPILAYPNPTRGVLHLNFLSTSEQRQHLMVTDLTGRVLQEQDVQVKEGENFLELDLTGYARGAYLVTFLREDAAAKTLRILVE